MFEAAELALYRLGAQPAHNNRTQRTAQVSISTPKQQSAVPASKAPSRTEQRSETCLKAERRKQAWTMSTRGTSVRAAKQTKAGGL